MPDILESFEKSGGEVTPEIRDLLASPAHRQVLYKMLVDRELLSAASILREAFREEMKYRDQLWSGAKEEPYGSHEGIFQCAFLLYRMGLTEDLELLHQASDLNQDVGEMDIEYFVGPGPDVSAEFLDQSNIKGAEFLAAAIREWADDPESPTWLHSWEERQLYAFRQA